MGRWSRPVATEFIAWLDVPQARAWLDVGCGTGALSETIARQASPTHLNALDASPAYIAQARQHLAGANARVVLGLAQQMPLRSQCFDLPALGAFIDAHYALGPENFCADGLDVTDPDGGIPADCGEAPDGGDAGNG